LYTKPNADIIALTSDLGRLSQPLFHTISWHARIVIIMDTSFACLALLEHEAFLLYEAMFDKAEDDQIRLLLGKIMLETKCHGEILQEANKQANAATPQTPGNVECEKEMGQLYTRAVESTRSLREKALQGRPISEIATELLQCETQLSEEYFNEIHSRLRATVQTNPAIKRILEDIAEDEKRHVETLNLILEMSSESQLPIREYIRRLER
jgi:rubrerythrin